MFNPRSDQIVELAGLANLSDREARTDLAGGYIRDEDDYTSNLVGALRRNISAHSVTGLTATSFMISTEEERSIGCDAAIVVTSNGYSKIALFEAKYPRFAKPGHYRWDKGQPKAATLRCAHLEVKW